ncbi:hypothetical protein NSS71_08240 [Niallia sp. FSL W8-0951]|uniref:hypothetical protein n=1 Tax=unclassified Niallia TaxID=2837522 RepID=UPI0030FA1788
MENFKVEKVTHLVNGEENIEIIENDFEGIDEAVEHYLEYNTSKFPVNANKVTFYICEEDDSGTVIYSKFKNKWYGSEYRFNFKGYYQDNLLFSIEGNEVDIANYLFNNIDKINTECNLKLDIDDFKSKIVPYNDIIEDLLEEMNTGEAEFELLDI